MSLNKKKDEINQSDQVVKREKGGKGAVRFRWSMALSVCPDIEIVFAKTEETNELIDCPSEWLRWTLGGGHLHLDRHERIFEHDYQVLVVETRKALRENDTTMLSEQSTKCRCSLRAIGTVET